MPSPNHLPAKPASKGRFARILLILAGLVYTGWEMWKLISEVRRDLDR